MTRKPRTVFVIITAPYANKKAGEKLELDPVLASSIVSLGVAKYVTDETKLKTSKNTKDEKII